MPATASPEWEVLWHPTAAFSRLAQAPLNGRWVCWRRPLFFALVIGCTVSLLTARSLGLRLVLSATATWTFVPLLEIASLAAVWRWQRCPLPLAATIDLFFVGNAPWTLWLIASGVFWASSPQLISSPTAAYTWLGSAGAILAWCAYLDLCFWRIAMKRSLPAALGDLVLQHALAWAPGILIFGAGSLRVDLERLWP